MLDFTLEETQWQEDWESLLATAAQPGSALEQLHVFALAHILRRPIIVYGVKYVKSFRGEDIGKYPLRKIFHTCTYYIIKQNIFIQVMQDSKVFTFHFYGNLHFVFVRLLLWVIRVDISRL